MNYVSFSLFLIMRLFSWILQLFFATVAFLRHLTLFWIAKQAKQFKSLFAKREKFWVNVYYAWNLSIWNVTPCESM